MTGTYAVPAVIRPCWAAHGPAALADYLAAAGQTAPGLEDLWLHASVLDGLNLPAAITRADRPALDPFMERDIAGRRYRVYVPAWESRSPFRECASPGELAAALAAYRRAVGVGWRINGGVTSDELLKALRRGQGERAPWLIPTEMPPREVWDGCEERAHFARTPVDGEWLHGYDLNGAYLAAASSLELPVGRCRQVPNPNLAMVRGRPGYWRIHDRWVTSPTAIYEAERLGGQLPVAEGVTWDAHGRHLRSWYERLRDARTALLADHGPGAGAALAAVKQTYTAGIGYLAYQPKADRRSPLYQPYWQHAVVALARCNLYRRLDRLTASPVYVLTDAAYFATDNPDPVKVAVGLGLPLGVGLGQFKVQGSWALDAPLTVRGGETTIRAAIDTGPAEAFAAIYAAMVQP